MVSVCQASKDWTLLEVERCQRNWINQITFFSSKKRISFDIRCFFSFLSSTLPRGPSAGAHGRLALVGVRVCQVQVSEWLQVRERGIPVLVHELLRPRGLVPDQGGEMRP